MSTSCDHGMNYEAALDALYSPLHQAQTTEAIEKSAARRTTTVSDMRRYLARIGLYNPTGQNVISEKTLIHITGTKGKGSTAAFCESLLRYQGKRTGLFTSPHLVDIRERIRLDGRPVSKAVFARAYWTIRLLLESYASSDREEDDLPPYPGYFRMLTLMVCDVT